MRDLRDAVRLSVGTLTVLPVTPPRSVTPRVAGAAMVLAPLAVLPLAVAVGVVLGVAQVVAAPPLLAALVAVGLMALGTGGLHLDGLADTADGLGVPGGLERRWEVMRRGDVGPLGAATLVLVLGVQAASLAHLVDQDGTLAAPAFVSAVLASRAALAVACTRGVPAARGDGLGATVAGAVHPASALLVGASGAGLAILVVGPAGGVAVVTGLVAAAWVVRRAWSRLGGVTGDVLGACVEVSLAACLAALAVAA